MTEARPEKEKKYGHVYDDETIENMVRYYRVQENFDSLLRYIKSRGLNQDDGL